MSKSNVILFDPTSPALDSPVFQLNGQITVIAMGLPVGDFITFEIIRLAAGDPSRICGCRLSEATGATIDLTQPLTCAVCGPEDNQQPVRLTANNSTIVLDAPQGALLRAIYHGVGVDQQLVNVWYNDTSTTDITDAMRGCAPEEVWTPTGTIRCEGGNVEAQEVSSCGATRWVVDRPATWTPTGTTRCAGGSVERQEVSPCGELQWVVDRPETWVATGEQMCDTTLGVIKDQEVNDCGDLRWTAGTAFTWELTGETACDLTTETFSQQEISPCGETRWTQVTLPPEMSFWTETGEIRCGATVEKQEVSPCGQLRWTDAGAITWVRTGEQDCVFLDPQNPGDVVIEYYIRYQERDNCGNLRWTDSLPDTFMAFANPAELFCDSDNVYVSLTTVCGSTTPALLVDAANWQLTGQTRCVINPDDPQLDEVQAEEVSFCGTSRWVPTGITGDAVWRSTGEYVCGDDGITLKRVLRTICCGCVHERYEDIIPDENEPEAQEQNWRQTGVFRCLSDPEVIETEETNECGSVRWSTCGSVTWTPTGATQLMSGESMVQEVNQCGETRWRQIPANVINWTLTGVQSCIGGFYHNQESDGYGNLRVVATTEPCGGNGNCTEILTEAFDSGLINYAAKPGAGFVQSLHVLPHGLSAAPDFVTVEFVNKVAQAGYAPGDIIQMNPHSADAQGGQATGWAIKMDATNITLSFDTNSGASMHEWNQNGNIRLVNSSWDFRVRAYI